MFKGNLFDFYLTRGCVFASPVAHNLLIVANLVSVEASEFTQPTLTNWKNYMSNKVVQL